MKQWKIFLFCMIMVFALSGCGENTISREQYDAVCAERDELQTQLAASDVEADIVKVDICGNFVGRVHYLIPDYCLDASTPQVAIVTQFQCPPFAVHVGALAEELEVGKTYVFSLQTKEAVEILRSEYTEGALDPAQMIPYYGLQVESVREATAEELGLDGGLLKYELAN